MKNADSTQHPKLVAFVATCDAQNARRFYEDVLGLKLEADEPYAIVFDAGGTTLRVQKVERFTPQPFTALGWQVADIEARVRALTAKGVRMERFAGMQHDDLGVWRSPSGARVAWFKDPDGNTLSLTQI